MAIMQLGHSQQLFVQKVREALERHESEFGDINQKVDTYKFICELL